MANYFVDSTTGNDANSGLTMDLAFATLQYVATAITLSPDDRVWIRKVHTEIPTANIAPGDDGLASQPIYVYGWPRNTHAISSSDWTNGNNVVTITDNDMSKTAHVGRYIVGPDGNVYIITRVISSSSINIDKAYLGTTQTGVGATIQADPHWDEAQLIDDTGWTINKSSWNGDTDGLFLIDFNGTSYMIDLSLAKFWVFKNLFARDGSNTNGVLRIYSRCSCFLGEGLLIESSYASVECIQVYGTTTVLRRCILTGDGASDNQLGLYCNAGRVKLIDSAIYNLGDEGIVIGSGSLEMENVNIGIEAINGTAPDLYVFHGAAKIFGRDVKIGGTNGYIDWYHPGFYEKAQFENFNKEFGNHYTFLPEGIYQRAAVSGESANKKNTDYVIKYSPNTSGYNFLIEEWQRQLLYAEIEVDTTSRNYTINIYNDALGTLNSTTAKDNVYMRIKYISAIDGNNIIWSTAYSTETSIASALDADDWDTLTITGVIPAVEGKIILEVLSSIYAASGNLLIDEEILIT